MQPGFMIYADDWENYFSDYRVEEIGEMLKALLQYFLTGETTEFSDRGMRQFFRQAAKAIDLDRMRYDKKCLQNAYNRYRGICKKNHEEPNSYEEWLAINDRQELLTKVEESFSIPTTNNQYSVVKSQPSVLNEQKPEGMQGKSIFSPVEWLYSERRGQRCEEVGVDW